MTMYAFTNYAKDHIKDYLPPEYLSADVTMDQVQKLDGQYTGMMVKLEDQMSAPIANLDQFFCQYQKTESLDEVMQAIADIVQMKMDFEPELNGLQNYKSVKSKLFVRLSYLHNSVNLMADGPHRSCGDMLMTYHILASHDRGDGFYTIRITNQLMESYGVTEEELHRDAISNSHKLFTPKLQSLTEMVTGIPEDEPAFIVVTNQECIFGAGILFADGIMDQVAETLCGNYFIIPSSIHEMLAIPDNGSFQITDLKRMLLEANATVVKPEDILSESIYYYDAKNHIFEIVAA